MSRCVGGTMLGPSSFPSRSVTPPLTEATRSRRQTRVPSSTSVCVPAPPSLSSDRVLDLERIYTDSSDVEEPAPRRWGVWQGATLATEAVYSEAGASAQNVSDSPISASDASSDRYQCGSVLHSSSSDLIELPASRAFANRAERPVSATSSGQEASESERTSAASMSRLRNKRTAAWGKSRASASSARADDTAATSKLMEEDAAWVIIQKWRRIVDANFDSSVPAPVSKFTQLAEVLDVANMDPTQQQKTVEATGMPLPEILSIQDQRQTALFSLMHIHSGLVFKIAARLKGSMTGLPDLEDVAMEGMVQLRLCIWSYSKSHGTTFSTHAWVQLEGRLKAALYGKDRVMALPLSEMSQRRRVWAAHSVIQAERRNGGAGAGSVAEGVDAATIAAVVQRAHVAESVAARILSGAHAHAEIFPDAIHSDVGDVWETIATDTSSSAGSAGSDENDAGGRDGGEAEEDAELLRVLDVPELRGMVDDVLNRIPLVQGDVIAYKYGLRGEAPLPYKEIAARLGFNSQSLVRYHHNKAMKSFSSVMMYMHKVVE